MRTFRETVENIIAWNRRFERHSDLIVPGRDAADVSAAHAAGKTAIIFGLQIARQLETTLVWLKSAMILASASCNCPITIKVCWRPAVMRAMMPASPAWAGK
jgi:hypothetical protein